MDLRWTPGETNPAAAAAEGKRIVWVRKVKTNSWYQLLSSIRFRGRRLVTFIYFIWLTLTSSSWVPGFFCSVHLWENLSLSSWHSWITSQMLVTPAHVLMAAVLFPACYQTSESVNQMLKEWMSGCWLRVWSRFDTWTRTLCLSSCVIFSLFCSRSSSTWENRATENCFL